MNMRNRLLAILLGTVTMISVLSGCGKNSGSGSTHIAPADGGASESGVTGQISTASGESEAETSEGIESEAAASAIEERRAEAENSGTYKKVVYALYTWTGKPAGTQRVQDAMNEILRDKLALEVELLPMDFASYAQNIRMMLSAGEQIDIFGINPLGYSQTVNDGYLIDLEEDGLLDKYGQGIKSCLPEKYIDALRINGTLYSLAPVKDFAIGAETYCIGREYLDGIGYDYSSKDDEQGVIHTTRDEISEIFESLHRKFPDKYVFAVSPNTFGQGSVVDPIGGDWFGVLMDPVNSLEVEDLFSSDEFMNRCKVVYEWNQKGYISADALTDNTSISAQIKAGTHMAMMSQGKPGYQVQISAECGRPMELFQVAPDIMKSSAVSSVNHGISCNCEDTVAAMQLLNELYTNPELSNLLVWGQEGKDYVMTEDGHITFPEGVDPSNAEYYHTMNWEMPNSYICYAWEGDSLTLGEDMKKFNDAAQVSKAMGFTFDNSSLAAEYTALTNVYEQYYKQLFYGFLDPEVGVPQMETDLKAAGLDEYIEAKKEALDKWAEANGVQ